MAHETYLDRAKRIIKIYRFIKALSYSASCESQSIHLNTYAIVNYINNEDVIVSYEFKIEDEKLFKEVLNLIQSNISTNNEKEMIAKIENYIIDGTLNVSNVFYETNSKINNGFKTYCIKLTGE